MGWESPWSWLPKRSIDSSSNLSNEIGVTLPETCHPAQDHHRRTPFRIKFRDSLMGMLIAVGGISTIIALLLVVCVLVGTTVPLLSRTTFGAWSKLAVSNYVHYGIDDNAALMWGMTRAGDIELRSLADGQLLATFPFVHSGRMTSTCLTLDRAALAVGFDDGTVRTASIEFDERLLSRASLPEGIAVSEQQPTQVLDETIYQWIEGNGVRTTRLKEVVWSEPVPLCDGPIVALDFLPAERVNRFVPPSTSQFLAVSRMRNGEASELVVGRIGSSSSLRNGTEFLLAKSSIPIRSRARDGMPLRVALMSGSGNALIVWQNGIIDRFEQLDDGPLRQVESQSAVLSGETLTCAALLPGRQTLLCGTEDGHILGWTLVNASDPEQESALEFATPAGTGFGLSLSHYVAIGETAVRNLCSGNSPHLVGAVDCSNVVSVVFVTTDDLLRQSKPVSEKADSEQEIRSVAFAPSGDLLLAMSDDAVFVSELGQSYPDASAKTFFTKVWYEGHDRPKYIWQSSAAGDESEIKLSLVPLLFGTLKAAVFAMFFSVPISILAAVYASEFLGAGVRGLVKPTVELMASMPGVVLGYVAAVVVAPLLRQELMTCLSAIVLVPLSFLIAGHGWRLMWHANIFSGRTLTRLPCLIGCLWCAVKLSKWSGKFFENVWFNGSLVEWMGTGSGDATGGWVLVAMPLLALVATFAAGPIYEVAQKRMVPSSALGLATLAVMELVILSLLVLGFAWMIGSALSAMGWDLRASLFRDYQDHNAVLLGGALGFLVIPVIFTISDDALRAVPQSLRNASFACGATQWQTTVRIVIPAALGGLASAAMVGLGRAIGETMVVLMTVGNTPLMEWNPFNGLRAITATLATELPETSMGSSHYRTLFVAALILFTFNLAVNTVAEWVRVRSRARISRL